MSRILTNVPSLVAQRTLTQQNASLNNTLQRLATGFRINRGADDPAGLIASENLRAEKAAITSAISNAERADQVINIAEGGLTEVSNLLTELQGLVAGAANDAGLSAEEKEANQLQIDSILQTIDRIANATSFQGTKLLNGTFDYTTSGVTAADISEVSIDAAKIPNGGSVGVTATFVSSAEKGLVQFSQGTSAISSGSLTIEVAGNKGVQQFTFASGTTFSAIAAGINAFSSTTGVNATASGDIINFQSASFGTSEFVSVTKVAGNAIYDEFNGASDAKDFGEDIGVNINGQTAQSDGLVARVAGASLDVTINFQEAYNTAGSSTSFDITGGGATFQLSPQLDLAGKSSIGIQAVTTGRLGSAANGRLSLLGAGGTSNVVSGDIDKAQAIVEDAIKQVSKTRGRLGAFQANTIGATVRALNVSLENTSAAESQIRETDFALETANLTRSQILVNAATNVLAISNAQPQNVLGLLG